MYKLLPLFAAFALAFAPQARAQLVYTPKNPAFGGSAINYQWMLSSANAQKSFDQGDRFDFSRDPLENFQRSLQRQLLNQLSRQIIERQFGDNALDLTREGRYDLGQFVVEIVPGLNGLNIQIFNAVTGEEATITIPKF